MATNFDKALYQAPLGMQDVEDTGAIEIEVIDPEEVNIHAGPFEISIGGEDDVATPEFGDNLAEFMADSDLTSLASEIMDDVDNDKNSRKEWERTYKEGLKLLGLQYEERTEPWDGACGVFHPMITEAIVRFQSEAITEAFPAQGPVRTKIIGKETPEKLAAAARVEADMNHQLTDVMVEYRAEHERLLWSLPAAGSAFKKIYYDPSLERQVAVFIPAEDIILPYGASDIFSTPRLTHEMRKTRNEVIKLQKAGFYRDIELPSPAQMKEDIQQAKDKETGLSDLNDDRLVLREIHADVIVKGFEDRDDDDEDTGISLPYVLTIIKGTNDVLAIRRNWEETDPLRLKRQHFVHYQYIPGFGAYAFGLFHLIGGFAKSATSIMRQLVDAGTLSNLPGGLKSRGLRIKGDDTPIAPGEWRDVDLGSGNIRDSILPLPYKEPSSVLFQLLGTIVEEGRRFAATADMKISDMSGQAPVGTTLALLERQLKVMTAVQARLHDTMKQEMRLLKNIIRDYTDDDYSYEPETGKPRAKQADYDDVNVLPVSDPNAATLSQRVVQYQAVIQMAQMAPDIYNLPQLHRGMLDVLGIKNAEKLVPLPDDIKPMDPVSENMAILKGEPIKAFFHQDHASHIAVHMAAMQDPLIAQVMGQNPRAPQIMAAAAAHLSEHAGFRYRQQIEQQLGMPMPPEDEKLPPQLEVALSGMMAQAAQQALTQNQQQAQQQQAQQQAKDPVLQLQQQELALKEREVAVKERTAEVAEKKMAADAAAQSDRLDLDNKKFLVDAAAREDQLNSEQARTVAQMQQKAE